MMTSVRNSSWAHKLHRLLADLCTARGKRSGKRSERKARSGNQERKTHAHFAPAPGVFTFSHFPPRALISSHSLETRWLFTPFRLAYFRWNSLLTGHAPRWRAVVKRGVAPISIICYMRTRVGYAISPGAAEKRAKGLPRSTVALPWVFGTKFWDYD